MILWWPFIQWQKIRSAYWTHKLSRNTSGRHEGGPYAEPGCGGEAERPPQS